VEITSTPTVNKYVEEGRTTKRNECLQHSPNMLSKPHYSFPDIYTNLSDITGKVKKQLENGQLGNSATRISNN
jgi:hypothetical protein